jgi:uncharacterized protein
MAQIGKMNSLRVIKNLDFGAYLDGGAHGEILLPRRYVPEDIEIGNDIDVFIYFDSEDRIIATTDVPYAQLNEFAYLRVAEVGEYGAFLDWGLVKDLFVPFREMKRKMELGKAYVVYIYLDEQSNRLCATARVDRFLDTTPHNFLEGQAVDLLIFTQTDLGFKAIINLTHTGVIYHNEVFQNIRIGDKLKGFIKKIREDGKIDLSIYEEGYGKIDEIAEKVLAKLRLRDGWLPINDKSSPEQIYNLFGVSKKNYKKALGSLYKNQLITIDNDGIRLVEEEDLNEE